MALEKPEDYQRDLALEQQMLSEEQRKRIQSEGSLELEHVLRDPGKFGAPTFQEFCRDPDKWRQGGDRLFRSISNGGMINQFLKSMEYEFMGYKTKSLEEIERIAKNEGYEIRDLEMLPQFVDVGRDKGKLLVRFKVKQPKLPSNLVETI